MLYRSTRGEEKKFTSSEAILKGIADDGGLFLPEKIPSIDCDLKDLLNFSYKEIAYEVMSKFFTDFTQSELEYCIENAYDEKFDTDEIAPLKKVGNYYFLELFHGPTLAFKDMALSILPYLLKTSAKKQDINKEIVILTATSGDTGKAALQGFSDVEGTKIIVFYPEDGVSPVQKLQMITHKGSNTFVVGIKGNFDDAQTGVKKIFADEDFNKMLNENNYMFSSANSINIGRLIPQVVYYFHAYLSLWRSNQIKEGEKINVVVPTGNFGNILAAYIAKEMGLPIEKLLCASNSNKVLYDFFNTGIYDKNRHFYTTMSPSMDILVSSNLERLLYIINGKDSEKTKDLMKSLNEKGRYDISREMKNNLNSFVGGYATENETKIAIKNVYNSNGYIMDPHTAVAYSVLKKYEKESNDFTKTVIASTASPYKFSYSVMTSIDDKYENIDDFNLMQEISNIQNKPIPKSVNGIKDRPVLHKRLCKKEEMQDIIKQILIL